ncbi:hypothetical protein SteCoe_174 [Stentor coeruleus]|uniref:Uncharacterized protein n=1 Tax=Stentor coeruleus TaxID=5963 RepID=A0A1R2D4M7_9CILI|nr:hypothetical protein SteCoe_174 [Stentor coeruleus]
MVSRDQDFSFNFKIVICGESCVGKTHLTLKFKDGQVQSSPDPTIGVCFYEMVVQPYLNENAKVILWDMAGLERYRAITYAHYRRANGALVVYDVTNKNSFIKCKDFIDMLRGTGDSNIVIMLVGNKKDLVDDNQIIREVTYEQGEKFAIENEILFIETSACTGFNVKEAFNNVFENIYQKIVLNSINK